MDSELLLGVALIGAGVAVVGVGVGEFMNSKQLVGVALIGLGVAGVGGGVAVLHSGTQLMTRLRAPITIPAERPHNQPGTDTERPGGPTA